MPHMESRDLSHSKKEAEYHVGQIITVSDKMQSGYSYSLSEPIGKNFDPAFTPAFSPAQMLELGVFEGKYLNDCTREFPKEWFVTAFKKEKLSPSSPDISKNYFSVKSRQPLSVWIQKHWITPNDPDVRGWFQWYCRYYLGRREPVLDQRQIKRWRAFRRHAAQVKKHCASGDLHCRPRQRQALLQWAYDPFL